MSVVAKIHGFEWVIDVDDWGANGKDAAMCALRIVRKISALPMATVEKARAEYLEAKRDDEKFDVFLNAYGDPGRVFDAIDDACMAAKEEVMTGWAGIPKSGYNSGAWPIGDV